LTEIWLVPQLDDLQNR